MITIGNLVDVGNVHIQVAILMQEMLCIVGPTGGGYDKEVT